MVWRVREFVKRKWQALFLTFGRDWKRVHVPREKLLGVHFLNGPVEINRTPHYFFAREVSSGGAGGAEIWREYMRLQHSYTNEQIQLKEKKFLHIMKAAQQRRSHFVVVVKPRGEQFIILDGLHRAASWLVFQPERPLDCWVKVR